MIMELSRDKMLEMYRQMLRIRYFESKVSQLFAEGVLPGFVHLYIGQEAVAVGVCSALDDDDYITSTHRGHGHIIAKGGKLDRAMAELFGKRTGYNKGKGGSMHMAHTELGILGANGIVGGGIPIATGAGLSAKMRGTKEVAVAFFGDGASNQGTFHESINLAAAFDLPVVYVCENNLYGVGTRQSKVRKVEDIADRAIGYAIAGVIVDGNDVLEVYKAAVEAINRARRGEGPTLIECKTYRWHTHFEGEPDTYRPPEEVAEWKAKEPIGRFEKYLEDEKIARAEELAAIRREVEKELEEAVEFAQNSPEPELYEALEDVYA
jgi:pyruvate dehydrogenase E1 component alpha subunit